MLFEAKKNGAFLTFGKKDEGEPETRKRRSAREREGLSQRRAQKKKERVKECVCLLFALSLFLSSFALRRAEKEKGKERCIDLRARGFFHTPLSLSKTWNTNTSGAGKRRLKFSD